MIYSFYQNRYNEKCSSSLILMAFQLCSSLRHVVFVKGLWGHLVVIWGITDSNREEWNLPIDKLSVGDVCSTLGFFPPKSPLMIILGGYFLQFKSVHMTTGWNPGSINHCTCNIYSTVKQLLQSRVAGCVFKGGNEYALLTIYHYKVNFFKNSVPSSQAAGKEYIRCYWALAVGNPSERTIKWHMMFLIHPGTCGVNVSLNVC